MMAGMKVTLSAAMRARDVSRPRPDDEEAAREADGPRPAGSTRARPGRTDSRTDGGDRPETAAARGGSGGRRRKRR